VKSGAQLRRGLPSEMVDALWWRANPFVGRHIIIMPPRVSVVKSRLVMAVKGLLLLPPDFPLGGAAFFCVRAFSRLNSLLQVRGVHLSENFNFRCISLVVFS